MTLFTSIVIFFSAIKVSGEDKVALSGLDTLDNAGDIIVGGANGVPTSTTMSGDITINSSGVSSIGNDKVLVTHIDTGAVESAQIASDAVTKGKIHPDVAGSGITQNADGSLEISYNSSKSFLKHISFLKAFSWVISLSANASNCIGISSAK